MNVKNRNLIRRLSWRSLRASRKRNIIAMTAIALTALMLTSLFTIAMSINSSYEMYMFRQIGGYCHGTFKEVTEEQLLKIAAHSNVKDVGKRITIGYIESGIFEKVPAEVSFMDDNCAEWSFAEPLIGHNPQKGKEITMDTNALKLLGIEPKLGAEIRLNYTVGASTNTAYEKTDIFTLAGWWESDNICPVHYINISEEYAKEMEAEAMSRGMEPFRVDLNVMMKSGMNIRSQMEQVNLDLGYSWDKTMAGELVRIGVNWGYTSSQLVENMDASTVIAIMAFLILIVFTGYLIIYNIFQISVTEDIQFYGLLKTIGATPRQLRRMIRHQALILCAVGIPVGLLLGYVVGAALTPVVISKAALVGVITNISTSPLIFTVSILFTLVTVFLSCFRPGRIAAKVSPVEAVKYTDVTKNKRKHRNIRGAKVYQMALANLGRNQNKTILVIVSLALSVVLFNILVIFTGGFDMDKYLAKKTCADFIVSSPEYFRFAFSNDSYISEKQIEQIEATISPSLSGYGYTSAGYKPIGWMSEEHWMRDMTHYTSTEDAQAILEQQDRRGSLVSQNALIEGLDATLFDKLTVVEGDITPMFQDDTNAIAVVVNTDDYGNVNDLDFYPPLGSTQTITYIEEGNYIDSRTGELLDENTPEEFLKFRISASHDVDYTICAYVTVPYTMSYRFYTTGYSFLLPVEKLKKDSQERIVPMFYLFDTPDDITEKFAESYLADLTEDEASGLMYESKANLRAEFNGFQNMFLLLGSLLCAVIGIIGILNFFNTIMTGILSRKREFAVLQAVGMTNRQLKIMLVYEGLFYAMGSVLAALILSLIINPLIGDILENMFWFFSANFTIIPVLTAIPVFALIGWMIPSIIYEKSVKCSIVERLRDI